MDPAATRRANLLKARDLGLAVARLAESQMIQESQLDDMGPWGTFVVTRLIFEVDEQGGTPPGNGGEVEHAEKPGDALQADTISQEAAPNSSTCITSSEAAFLARKVREVALRPGNSGHYYGVLQELVLRFDLTTYNHITRQQYDRVLAFLAGYCAPGS